LGAAAATLATQKVEERVVVPFRQKVIGSIHRIAGKLGKPAAQNMPAPDAVNSEGATQSTLQNLSDDLRGPAISGPLAAAGGWIANRATNVALKKFHKQEAGLDLLTRKGATALRRPIHANLLLAQDDQILNPSKASLTDPDRIASWAVGSIESLSSNSVASR
jgi:hypothetical protein